MDFKNLLTPKVKESSNLGQVGSTPFLGFLVISSKYL